ncbi:hypothetical protein GGG16DRAFT_67177 [Schizophyllum commune]
MPHQPSYRGSPTILPNLATLELSCSLAIFGAFCDRVSAPSLSSLSLSMFGSGRRSAPASSALGRFLHRSGVPVRKLRVTTDGEELLRRCLPYLPHLEELTIHQARGGLHPGSSVLEPLLQVGPTMPCPLLQTVEFDRCGADIQWLLQFMRARASNLHHGQPVLRSVKVYFLTPPSGDVETLIAPFKTAGVHVDVKWTERR